MRVPNGRLILRWVKHRRDNTCRYFLNWLTKVDWGLLALRYFQLDEIILRLSWSCLEMYVRFRDDLAWSTTDSLIRTVDWESAATKHWHRVQVIKLNQMRGVLVTRNSCLKCCWLLSVSNLSGLGDHRQITWSFAVKKAACFWWHGF